MRLSDEAKQQAKQQVSPEAFWTTIVAVIVLVSIIPWQNASAFRWVWGALLVVLWSISLWRLFRFGRLALPWSQIVLLFGLTLMPAKEVWPHIPATGTWVEGTGMILIMIGTFAPYFTSVPHAEDGSDAA